MLAARSWSVCSLPASRRRLPQAWIPPGGRRIPHRESPDPSGGAAGSTYRAFPGDGGCRCASKARSEPPRRSGHRLRVLPLQQDPAGPASAGTPPESCRVLVCGNRSDGAANGTFGGFIPFAGGPPTHGQLAEGPCGEASLNRDTRVSSEVQGNPRRVMRLSQPAHVPQGNPFLVSRGQGVSIR